MAELGKELKAFRESKKITIEDVAALTRIGRRYLEALENDRFDMMPGGFFLKAMIRSYAAAIGLDPEKTVDRYKTAGIIDASPETHFNKTRDLSFFAGKNKMVVWTMVIIGLVIAAVVLTLLLRGDRKKDESKAPGAGGKPEQIQLLPAAPVPAPAQEQLQTASPAEKQPEGLLIEVTFTELTWMQVFADGTPVIDGVFPTGRKLSAKAEKQLLINVGNAGGFTFTLNGRNGKAIGLPGQVKKDVKISLDNIGEFIEDAAGDPDPVRKPEGVGSGSL